MRVVGDSKLGEKPAASDDGDGRDEPLPRLSVACEQPPLE